MVDAAKLEAMHAAAGQLQAAVTPDNTRCTYCRVKIVEGEAGRWKDSYGYTCDQDPSLFGRHLPGYVDLYEVEEYAQELLKTVGEVQAL